MNKSIKTLTYYTFDTSQVRGPVETFDLGYDGYDCC